MVFCYSRSFNQIFIDENMDMYENTKTKRLDGRRTVPITKAQDMLW